MKEFIDKLIAKLEQESQVVTTPIIEIECLKLSDAIDAVNRVAEEYGNQAISSHDLEIIGALPSLYPLKDFEEEAIQRVVGNNSDGWIPCCERLPEIGVDVFLQDFSGDYEGGYREIKDGIDGFTSGDWWTSANHYVAWRPLPAPYQKKGE